MIKVVPKLFGILELFSPGNDLTFSEVVERTGLSRSNVSHLLKALCDADVLSRSGYGVYRRGEKLTNLCVCGNPWRELIFMAERCVANLSTKYNSMAVAAVRAQERRLTLVKYRPETNGVVRQAEEMHRQADWYNTASGRILLAYSSEDFMRECVRRCNLPEREVWKEASSQPKLFACLEKIRQQGYAAISYDNGITALAVPGRDASGERVLAFSIAHSVQNPPLEDVLDFMRYNVDNFEREMEIRGLRVTDLCTTGDTEMTL